MEQGKSNEERSYGWNKAKGRNEGGSKGGTKKQKNENKKVKEGTNNLPRKIHVARRRRDSWGASSSASSFLFQILQIEIKASLHRLASNHARQRHLLCSRHPDQRDSPVHRGNRLVLMQQWLPRPSRGPPPPKCTAAWRDNTTVPSLWVSHSVYQCFPDTDM